MSRRLKAEHTEPEVFATTHWSVIIGAQKRGAVEAEAALEKLCKTN